MRPLDLLFYATRGELLRALFIVAADDCVLPYLGLSGL